MGPDLRRIIYVSTAAELDEAELNAIVERSIANNAAREITGLLYYNGRNFLQLIEGSQTALLTLMGVIARDPRHFGLVTVRNEAITERACAAWRMSLIRLSDDMAERRSRLADQIPPGLGSEARELIQSFALLN